MIGRLGAFGDVEPGAKCDNLTEQVRQAELRGGSNVAKLTNLRASRDRWCAIAEQQDALAKQDFGQRTGLTEALKIYAPPPPVVVRQAVTSAWPWWTPIAAGALVLGFVAVVATE